MPLPPDLDLPPESSYLNCIRCGLCLAVCPTYREHLKETSSPRGRVALARKAIEGEMALSPNLAEQMYACFACMACEAICPVGIRPAELALEMRSVQEQIAPSGWKRPLFEDLIPHPGRMEAATFPLRLYQALGIRRVAAPALARFAPGQLADLEAMLPKAPLRPLRPVLPEITPARGEANYRVGFFLGCAQSLLFAGESAAAVRVLARSGCTVITPRQTQCCGMPARGYGRLDLVRDLARHNVALFERQPLDWIVTDCATCGSTLKDYGALLQDDPEWAERAAAFSSKVRDISEVLAEIPLAPPSIRLHARVTYHDPCHLRRGQGVWKQPRALLERLDGVDFVELPEADWCCGSAGSQLITHYETSLKVLSRKIDAVESTGAAVVASGCPGCQMQLTAGIKRRKLPVRVVHPITLIDEAYGGEHA
jgi:glycolate oxidase iron-sulfur subunit